MINKLQFLKRKKKSKNGKEPTLSLDEMSSVVSTIYNAVGRSWKDIYYISLRPKLISIGSLAELMSIVISPIRFSKLLKAIRSRVGIKKPTQKNPKKPT